jgi:hypothetical protein
MLPATFHALPIVQHPIYFINIHMQQLQHTKDYDRCNIWNKHQKHLRKRLKTIKNYCKHMQHPDKIIANIHMQHLKHMLATCMYICNIPTKHLQHSSETDETFRNIHLKHTCIVITTCATSQYTFARSIYNTCSIPLKHLKYLKHTIVTFAFSVPSACCLNKRRLVDVDLDTGMELEAAEWRGGYRCGARGGTDLG